MTLTQIKKAGLDPIALDHVFTIGASGTDHYTFQGEGLNGTVNDPTLYLTRGKTYRFENGTGAHAIRIQSADNGTSGTLYNTGVTNNNTTGTVIVEVQHDAPDVLYYQCASHANMKGTIYVTGALADGGVTTAKIAAGAVTTAKIADDAITNAKVANDAIGTAELADNAVGTSQIAGGAVVQAKIGANAVTTAKIADTQITTAKIVDGAVGTGKIADSAVTDAKINGMAASKLTGALPAISGASLTNLPGGGKVTRVFIDTEGSQNTVGHGTSNRTYLTLTVTNVPSTSTRYLIYITYNQQPQVQNSSTHAAISTYSETNASTVGFNFSNNVQTSTLFNGFRFDTASNTSDRTYTIQHRSNSGQTNKNSIMSSGAMVVLEIDAS